MSSFSLNVGKHQTITAAPQAADGQPGLLAPNLIPNWSVSPASGLSLAVAANGLSAAVSGTVPGSYTVTVTSQNPSTGPVAGSFTVVINVEDASTFAFSGGPVS